MDELNIYAPKGTRVIYKGFCGYDSDREYADKFLSVEEMYTVNRTDVGGWRTNVELKEFPGKMFNSVMFWEVKEGLCVMDTE